MTRAANSDFGEFMAKLTDSFGSGYANTVALAALQRRALGVIATDLDLLDIGAVTEHLAALHRLDGIRATALDILRGTGKVANALLRDRLPGDHIATALGHLAAADTS
jgi:hypothetical protein